MHQILPKRFRLFPSEDQIKISNTSQNNKTILLDCISVRLWRNISHGINSFKHVALPRNINVNVEQI